MNKKELLELLQNIEDEGSVDEVLTQTDLYKSSLSLDNFKKLVGENTDFKSFMDSEKDKHYTKALETWKANNLGKLVEAELLKKNPQLTPEQIELNNLKAEIENIKKEKQRAEMVSKFKDVLGEKKIPSKLVDFLLADDEEITNANITLFEESMKSYVTEQVEDRLKGSNYTPPGPDNKPGVKNPWSRETFNLTEQAKILKENPTLAQQLKASAVK